MAKITNGLMAPLVIGVSAWLASMPPVDAAESATQMHISVAVPRHSTIVESSEPACLSTAATSLLKTSAVYRVRSTSTTGMELVFEPASVVQSLAVRIVGETELIPIPPFGGSVTLRGHPVGESTIDVEYRLAMTSVEAGNCVTWPVRVEARPL